VIYLDTSALLKLYLIEAGSETVQTFVMAQDDPLPVWELQQVELLNGLRLKVFWGDIKGKQADQLIDMFDQRMRRGQYFFPDIARAELMATFRTLSRETSRIGCRTMDILHVACAIQLSPEHFVSFDERQRQLASYTGLHVLPE
jgi:predicted nucleic acid-binding protein